MKKSKIILLGTSILALASCNIRIDYTSNKTEDITDDENTDVKAIKKKINETNSYLEEQNLNANLFANILQAKLNNSLVYNVADKEYLIEYNDDNYHLSEAGLENDSNNYLFVNTVNDAFDYEVGTKLFTKGYYSACDGGNGYFELCSYIDTIHPDELIISNEEKTLSLKYISYESAVNLYQLGYKESDTMTLDSYVNDFTGYLKYLTIFIPENTYKITNNMDGKVSNKVYCGYNAKIYADDSYNPIGFNNGCVFNVYNNVENIQINGFDCEIKINKKLDDPLLGLLSARDVNGLEIANCKFHLPKEGSIYRSTGVIDFFTNWQNVVVRNCYLENFASTVAGGGVGFRDIYKKGCSNALFENNYLYSNCKDEVIAIFSGVDTSLTEDTVGGGSITNVVLKNNHIVGGKPNDEIGPRVVGLTIGYQVSPVYDISYIDNEIEMWTANYFMLYGKADGVTFKNNNIKIDSSYKKNFYVAFYHNPRSDLGQNIKVEDNNIEFVNDSTAYTISQTAEEFSFINNKITGKEISYVFKSKSVFESNEISFDKISKACYHNVKETKGNNITCKEIGVVFEFYNLNITDDIILSDKIKAETIGSYMMLFNGDAIYSNGHIVTFRNFTFDVARVESRWYGLAYGVQALKDKIVINFENADLSIYNDHNMIYLDDEGKVTVNYK